MTKKENKTLPNNQLVNHTIHLWHREKEYDIYMDNEGHTYKVTEKRYKYDKD